MRSIKKNYMMKFLKKSTMKNDTGTDINIKSKAYTSLLRRKSFTFEEQDHYDEMERSKRKKRILKTANQIMAKSR
jgi:hypothetical protein